jgi:hypothetical protein
VAEVSEPHGAQPSLDAERNLLHPQPGRKPRREPRADAGFFPLHPEEAPVRPGSAAKGNKPVRNEPGPSLRDLRSGR